MIIKNNLGTCLKLFLKNAKGNIGLLILGIFIAIINQFTTLFIPIFTKLIIDIVIIKNFYNYLPGLMLLGGGILLIGVITALVSNYILAKVNNLSGVNFKLGFFKKLQFAPFDFYQKVDKGSITHRILTDTEKITAFWVQACVTLPIAILLTSSAIIMLNFHRTLTILVFIILAFQAVIIVLFRKPMINYSFEAKEQSQKITSNTVEHFSNIELIRSLSTEEYEQEKFKKLLVEQVPINLKNFMIYKSSDIISVFVSNIWIFIVLGYGSIQINSGSLSLGTLTAFLLWTNILYKPVIMLTNLVLIYQDVKVSLHRIMEYQNVPFYLSKAGKEKISLKNEIYLEIQNVSFYFNNKPVLRNINMCIEPNKIIALVGKSGSGKSTLCKMLVRFFEPASGRIMLNNKDIKELDIKFLRENILLSLQSNHVFNGTILENLTYGIKNVEEREVLAAIKRAGMNFFYQLPAGFETVVGENGLNISGGEAQKIAIARAFIRKPKVFIFDETTAYLDAESENIIKNELLKLKESCTIIIVAHKPSMLTIADEIIMIENGSIVENKEKLLPLIQSTL